MTTFLIALWPNLTATLVGVIVGVPIALYLNRRFDDAQHARERAADRARLVASADVLVEACAYNAKILESIMSLAREGRVSRNPDLRTTTWDAVGSIFAPICPDPYLLQIVSHHWLRLQRFERLNEEVFGREVGALPRLKDRDMIPAMWGELYTNPENLLAHSKEIGERLKDIKEKKPNQALQTTPMTRSVYEKTIEFGHRRRGV